MAGPTFVAAPVVIMPGSYLCGADTSVSTSLKGDVSDDRSFCSAVSKKWQVDIETRWKFDKKLGDHKPIPIVRSHRQPRNVTRACKQDHYRARLPPVEVL